MYDRAYEVYLCPRRKYSDENSLVIGEGRRIVTVIWHGCL